MNPWRFGLTFLPGPAVMVPVAVLVLAASLALITKRDRVAIWLVVCAHLYVNVAFQASVEAGGRAIEGAQGPSDYGQQVGLWIERALGASDTLALLLIPAVAAGLAGLWHWRSFAADRRLGCVILAALTPLAWQRLPCCPEPSFVWERVALWFFLGTVAIGMRERVAAGPICWLAALIGVERYFLHVDSIFSGHCFNGGTNADPAILAFGMLRIYLAQQREIAAMGIAFAAGGVACWERRSETSWALAGIATTMLLTHPVWIYFLAESQSAFPGR